MGNKPGMHDLCIPVDSFDLMCESVMYIYVIIMPNTWVVCLYTYLNPSGHRAKG